jgi:CTP:molybdopterin cytidylyltransferase MocA
MTPARGGPAAAAGLLLAAGAGRRMGGPKALLRSADGELFVDRAVRMLLGGGCRSVTVVLGARADEVRSAARSLTGDRVDVVVAADWDEGMGATLRAGLDALSGAGAVEAALVHLVDLPDVGAEVVRRVLSAQVGPDGLARATYHGGPGHPVLLGRSHWPGIAAAAVGDRGARDYLADRAVLNVECGDLAGGQDLDRPERAERPKDH